MSIQQILVVDDDKLSREFLVEAVKSLGFQVSVATSGDDGLERVRNSPPDLVLTDLRMPGMDGLALVERLAKDAPGLPVVMVTAHGTVETAVQAMRLGAIDFLLKPCTPAALELVIQRVARTLRLQRENEYLRAEVTGVGATIVAESPGMLETLRSARKIARSKGTVLITGESGTGKERVAHLIHRESPRREAPFIRVNCAALSETFSRASCSATSAAPSPARTRAARAASNWPTAARCCSTRSARSRPRCKPSCCACSKRKNSSASAAARRSRSTCA